jgi:hypothetical protein
MFDWLSNSQNAIITATDPAGAVAANIGMRNARWLTTVSAASAMRGTGRWRQGRRRLGDDEHSTISVGHAGELHKHRQHHEFRLHCRVRRRVGVCQQLVGTREIRVYRTAQSHVGGRAGERRCLAATSSPTTTATFRWSPVQLTTNSAAGGEAKFRARKEKKDAAIESIASRSKASFRTR